MAVTEAQETLNKILGDMTNAGLCVCEKSLIPGHHPGLLTTDDVIRRVEEQQGLAEYDAAIREKRANQERVEEEKRGNCA